MGVLGGMGAAPGIVWTASGTPSSGTRVGMYTLVVLGVFCFVMWTGIVGWPIGVFLWEARDVDGKAPSRPSRQC